MNSNQTVFIIDDDKAIRDGICDLVEGLSLKAEAYASAEDFLDCYTPEREGCLVLDVRMPGMSGLELQHRLKQDQVNLPIVIITGHGDVPMAVKAMQEGAVDFIEKPFREQSLWESIKKALEAGVRRRRHSEEQNGIADRLGNLTSREVEVLELIMKGMSDKEAAGELSVSQRAVAFHRNHILEKMSCKSTVELVRKLARHETFESTHP